MTTTEPTTFRGALRYLGWSNTWTVGGVDIKETFWDLIERLSGKRAQQDYTKDRYRLSAGADEDMDLKHGGRGNGVILTLGDRGFGMTNVTAYSGWAFAAMNGREVIASFTDDSFSIEPTPDEEVFGVYYCGNGNAARVPAGKEAEICGIGTANACAFLTFASPGGFLCQKFNDSMGRALLERVAEGSIRAKRIGDCKLLGREPDEVAA